MINENGWYKINGVKKFTVHYFYKDKPIHVLKHGSFEIDFSHRYPAKFNPCKRCLAILKAYSNIGLENRLI